MYQFKVVSYGLQSSCSALLSLYDILDPRDYVVHYIRKIYKVFGTLDEVAIRIKSEKYKFYQNEVT